MPTPLSFTASGGQQVVFKQVGNQWQAQVRPLLPVGFSYTTQLPVVCAGELEDMYTLGVIIKRILAMKALTGYRKDALLYNLYCPKWDKR